MAQNKNGPVIGMAIFMLLTVVLGGFLYYMAGENQKMSAQLTAANNEQQSVKATITQQNNELALLKDLAGGYAPGDEVGVGDPNAEESINAQVRKLISDKAGDETAVPPNLTGALIRTAAESDNHSFAADNRLQMYNAKTRELQQTIAAKDEEIAKHKQARDEAETSLVTREAEHSKQMANLEQANDTLRTEKAELDQRLNLQITNLSTSLRDANERIDQYQNTVESLRDRLRKIEDFSFFKPDGMITSVDHQQQLVYVNVGAADGLTVGVTFSVYGRKNSGVGKLATSDIKGSVVIVKLLGANRAEARIIGEKPGEPIAPEDPIFSPIFQSGQSIEIAVIGQLKSEGLTRDRFHSLLRDHGVTVAIEIDDEGNITDGRGNIITEEEMKRRINDGVSTLRFVVQGDYGRDTKDPALVKLFDVIRRNSEAVLAASEPQGIYPVGLGTFLEHIGYRRNHTAWTPDSSDGFPSRLANGARSPMVDGTVGARESFTPVSGIYGGRKSPNSVSSGAVSKKYSN